MQTSSRTTSARTASLGDGKVVDGFSRRGAAETDPHGAGAKLRRADRGVADFASPGASRDHAIARSFRKSTQLPGVSAKRSRPSVSRRFNCRAVLLEHRFLGTVPAGDRGRASQSAGVGLESEAGIEHRGSSVATAYFQLRELDLELEIAKRTLASRKESLQLTQYAGERRRHQPAGCAAGRATGGNGG